MKERFINCIILSAVVGVFTNNQNPKISKKRIIAPMHIVGENTNKGIGL